MKYNRGYKLRMSESSVSSSIGGLDLLSGNVEGVKFFYDERGVLQWRGFSGFLQWFYRWPFGFTLGMKDHPIAVRFNQIFWNIMIFIVLFGIIYKVMIDYRMLDTDNDTPSLASGAGGSSWLQAFYFSTITTTTLGVGNIMPKTTTAQIIVGIHLTLLVLFNIIWVCKFNV